MVVTEDVRDTADRPDPREAAWRADAALVYRYLRDHEPVTANAIAEACFPTTFGAADPVAKALAKSGRRRVSDAIVWMRHQPGVRIHCYPGSGDGSLFAITEMPELAKPSPVLPPSAPIEEAVTDEVSQDPWHPTTVV